MENLNRKWKMKKCEERRAFGFGKINNQITLSSFDADNDTICCEIYKLDNGLEIEDENLIFRFNLIRQD